MPRMIETMLRSLAAAPFAGSLATGLALAPALAQQNATPPGQPILRNEVTRGEFAGEAARAAEAARQNPAEVETWRRALVAQPGPGNGCFTASFPDRQWHPVACKPATPHKAYLPNTKVLSRIDTVGGSGTDFVATVTGDIRETDGSFDSATGITATGSYTLQLNTDFFQTDTCNGSPGGKNGTCRGWEQYVYTSDGSAFIQYWLIQFASTASNTACPAPVHNGCDGQHVFSDGWCPFNLSDGFTYCAIDAASEPPGVVSKALSAMGSLAVTGKAAAGGSNDSIILTDSGTAHAANGDNRFADLGSAWQQSEFNVFGDGGGSAVAFNSGANVRVRNVVLSGSTAGPGCSLRSFTAESSNLTLANAQPMGTASTPAPSLVWDEVNPPPASGTASCADAVSWGDTHLTTIGGLAYDFQATGDYVLLHAEPGFTVLARQVSGAPTWPNASVNKAIGVETGSNRVAVCPGGKVLVNGEATNLGDGQSQPLPGGGAVARRGGTYIVLDPAGHTARATVNPSNIDVTVGLGRWPIQVSGLLASHPNVASTIVRPAATTLGHAGMAEAPAHVSAATPAQTLQLTEAERSLVGSVAARDGAVLRAPFNFGELYGQFRESWVVSAARSPLDDCGGRVAAAAPRAPFTVADLPRDKAASTRALCTREGLAEGPLLDACMIDAAVIGPEGTRAYRTAIARTPVLFTDVKPER